MLLTCRVLILGIALSSILSGCAGRSAGCPIETLTFDEYMFPLGTHFEPLVSPVPEKPQESIGQALYFAPDYVFLMVIHWHSIRATTIEFNDYTDIAFEFDEFEGPWIALDNLYMSESADHYYTACGLGHGIYQCKMVATYGEYSVYLRADISEQGISLELFNDLLQSIDRKMDQCWR